jgi:tRNA uridine 5-carbamoylmethylation protein Kti12
MVLKKFEENIKATYKYHVDEYSIIDLKKIFKKSKFRKFKAWVNPDVLRVDSDNYLNSIKNDLLIKSATFLINKTFLVNLFGNDLFVLAKK